MTSWPEDRLPNFNLLTQGLPDPRTSFCTWVFPKNSLLGTGYMISLSKLTPYIVFFQKITIKISYLKKKKSKRLVSKEFVCPTCHASKLPTANFRSAGKSKPINQKPQVSAGEREDFTQSFGFLQQQGSSLLKSSGQQIVPANLTQILLSKPSKFLSFHQGISACHKQKLQWTPL